MRRRLFAVGATFGLLLSLPSHAAAEAEAAAPRPNFLVIVVDDLGFSDPGYMGSEIRTPHMDALAAEGLVLTNFHVSPACSPTRAMLLTGQDPHRVGLGTMRGEAAPEQRDRAGYEGVLDPTVETLAEALRAGGYHTYLSGKWHLGDAPHQLPTARGFERAFGPTGGGTSHFADGLDLFAADGPPPMADWRDDGEPVARLPADWFSTDGFTDRLIGQIEDGRGDGRPFFALAAFTAPHWPLQAPEAWIDRYAGAYDAGWDVLRVARMAAVRDSGLATTDGPPPERLPFVPAWEALDEAARARAARTMEVYAAMVSHLDHNIGRLLAYLEDTGRRRDTLVLLFSDNGAEGNPVNRIVTDADWVARTFDNRLDNIGRPGSYVFTGPGWAQASSVPFHLFKTFPTQGGIRTTAVIAGPDVVPGRRSDAFTTVMDLAPTLLVRAGLAPRERSRLDGRSLDPLLTDHAEAVHGPDRVTGWELFGRRAIRVGDWKALWLYEPYGLGRWQLFDLSRDPGERHDLASANPERLHALLQAWATYAEAHRVVLPDNDAGYALEEDWR